MIFASSEVDFGNNIWLINRQVSVAEEYNDLSVAYAMDKTKRYFSMKQLAENNTKAVQ
jgi:hypothetical protein